MKKILLACCCLSLSLLKGQNGPQPRNQPQIKTQAQATPQPQTTPQPPQSKTDAKSSAVTAPAGPDDLKNVMAQADKAAATFKTARAKFQWDQYERVVDETEVQKGDIYFRRTKSGMDAAVRVTSPDTKQVVFVDGTLKLFQPKIKQVTIYDARARRTEVDSLMNIGFGSRGEDVEKSYEVKMEGWETVDGVKTARLNLVPRNEKLKASITNIILWLDPQRDVSLKQKFIEPGENYRLTHYTDIELNPKISNDVFELKTPAGTTTVRP
jgi:outer membrane lipoprotein-sorting protein